MYVGDNAVLSAYTGWYQIFPATEREWNFEICYNITGGTHDILNPDVLGSIDWMEIDGVRMAPASAYTFAPGTTGIVKYKANRTNMAWQSNTLVTGATCYANPSAYAFEGCTNLTVVNLARVDGLGAGAFKNCGSLESITIPNGLLYIGDECFMGTALKSITIPDSSVQIIGKRCFISCPLTAVTLGTSIVEIQDYAFAYCTGITSVDLGSVEILGNNAFYMCTGLTSYSVGNNLKTIGQDAFNGCNFSYIVLPDSLTGISQYAFYENRNLIGLTLGTGIREINVDAFGRTALHEIYLGATNTVDVKSGAFGYNTSHVPGNGIFYYHTGADVTGFQTELPTWTFTTY